ncbi:hypothetical protein MalM25_30570 [Planctomycetes bacterium MalM25]|nr:hypothetical protein MalM25_30570 [Planctomycetes bacterium MalM25]
MTIAKSIAHSVILALLATTPCWGHAPGYCSDPVVTHTNGMRLASSTSLRNHNVYWRCDGGHIGYCDGKLHGPCRDSWRTLGTRCHGRFYPPHTPMGPTGSQTAHSADGMEYEQSESLGVLTSDGPRPTTQSPRLLGPATPAAGGGIQDALQAIGLGAAGG